MVSEKRVKEAFNNRVTSLPDGRLAHVPRTSYTNAISERLREPSTMVMIHGFIGVGKSSALELATAKAKRYAAWKRVIRLPHADLLDGVTYAVGQAFQESTHTKVRNLTKGEERRAESITQWLDEMRALLVIDNFQGLTCATRDRFLGLAKHLADQSRQYNQVQLVGVASGSRHHIRESLPAIRAPLEYVEIPPWEDRDLTAIVADGARKCSLEVDTGTASRIAAFSCGIPAATHLLAREICLGTVREQRTVVSAAHLDQLLGNRGRVEDLSERLMPEVDFVSAWRRQNDALVAAVVALAGRLSRDFTVEEMERHLGNVASSGDLERAAERALQDVPLALERWGDDRLAPRELVAGITAMLELQARAQSRDDAGATAAACLEVLLGLPRTVGGVEPETAAATTSASMSRSFGARRPKLLFIATQAYNKSFVAIDHEEIDIKKCLRCADPDVVDFERVGAVQPAHLMSLLDRVMPEILHFSGHAGENEITFVGPDDEARPIQNPDFVTLLRVAAGRIRLIVLNACYTESLGKALTDFVDVVIGTDRAIADSSARAFSARLYGDIASGCNVEEAFERAKAQLNVVGNPTGVVPKLMVRKGVRADGVVFVARGRAARSAAALD